MNRLQAPLETADWMGVSHHLGGGVRYYCTTECPDAIGLALFDLTHGRCEEHSICEDCALAVAYIFLSNLREQRVTPQPFDPMLKTASDVGADNTDLFIEDFGGIFATILDAIDELKEGR